MRTTIIVLLYVELQRIGVIRDLDRDTVSRASRLVDSDRAAILNSVVGRMIISVRRQLPAVSCCELPTFLRHATKGQCFGSLRLL
jgi:hypothetical protein